MPRAALALFSAIFFLVCATPQLAWAEPTPDPDDVETSLSRTMEALKQASEENRELAEREQKLQAELQHLQEDLVSIAGKIQRQEKILSDLETGLANLNRQETAAKKDLRARKGELAAILGSMVKLSSVPPEMVIAMPGDFSDTLRTAKVLGLTSSALDQKAEKIRGQLQEIDILQERIHKSRKQISAHKQKLEQNQSRLAGKLDERGELHDKLHSRHREQSRKLAALSKESNNLRDLLAQLETQRNEAAETAAKLAVIPKPRPKETRTEPPRKPDLSKNHMPFASAKGKISLPAEGNIFSFYGDKIKNGDESKGITIRTRHSAQITAPHPGEIVYTGPFLDYGNLVIIRHEENYHTLLAGLEQITAKPGQQILEGEPLGEMGKTDASTELYMEIRKDNRPIDPAPWLQAEYYANKRQIIR